MIIGITGTFGSGKTTIAEMFKGYGYKIINADKIAHSLLNKKEIKNAIIKEFGTSILTKGKINRRKLKDIVFNNHKELVRLNKIIHPAIIKKIKSIIKKTKNKKIIIDGALMIEANCLDLVDKLLVVKIKKEEQLRRILKKRKYTKKEIRNIIKSQLNQKQKLKYADYIIDNSNKIKDTKKQVEEIIKRIEQKN